MLTFKDAVYHQHEITAKKTLLSQKYLGFIFIQDINKSSWEKTKLIFPNKEIFIKYCC